MIAPRLAGRAIAALLCVVAACHQDDIVRMDVARRDIVLYGSSPFELPVRVTDRAGNVRRFPDVKLSTSAPSTVRFIPEQGAVVCDRAGSANVEVRAGALKEVLTVRCRPIAGLRRSPSEFFTLGDPPHAFEVEVEFPSGERELLRPVTVEVADSSVARVTTASIAAVAPGRTLVVGELGGLTVTLHVVVNQLLANDTLALRAGQFRNWTLEPGHYVMTVTRVDATNEPRWLELVTDGTKCVRDVRNGDTVHCVVYKSGAVVVRNVTRNAASPARRAWVRIVRQP